MTVPFDFSSMEPTPMTRKTQISGSTNRDSPGAKFSHTGKVEYNVGGTQLSDEVAHAVGQDVTNYSVRCSAIESNNLIVLYPVGPQDGLAVYVRHNKKRRTASIHLCEFLKQFPTLRVTGTRWCPMVQTNDKNGTLCLVIAVNGSFSRRSTAGAKKSADPAPTPNDIPNQS